jgi:hypothetical protein
MVNLVSEPVCACGVVEADYCMLGIRFHSHSNLMTAVVTVMYEKEVTYWFE